MRTSRWILGLVVVIGGWSLVRHEDTPRPPAAPQLAVVPGGFAVLDGVGARRVTELGRDGTRGRELPLAGVPAEARVVGTRSGIAVVWRDRARVQVAAVGRDGKLGTPRAFGKRVVATCDGVASNDRRFAVAWLEADGEVWFVHGPAGGAAGLAPSGLALARPATTWCAVASAGDRIALLWRRDRSLYITSCGKDCPGLPTRIRGAAATRPALGFGCVRDGCVLATRDAGGALHATWMTSGGAVRWDRVLPGYAGGAVEIVGAGERQLAIGYDTADAGGRPVVVAVTTAGEVTPRWQAPSGSLPTLAWARGVLAIAYQRGGRLETAVVALP